MAHTSARDAGVAIAAMLSAPECTHQAEPVTLSLTGETVAAICGRCMRELPVAWLD